ncbi:MAG TPA: acyl-CoA dehydrogenase family protein [Acidimicrobiales bacterium]|nr:acyl-CoA dehydrogenase family protein [Acidimicrobiales bacterium]
MDFRDSSEDAAFREEVRDWLADHLVGEFRENRGRGAPVSDDAFDLRREWERELGRGGWLGLGYPVAYGGRGASVGQQIIFTHECAKARAPYRVSVQGSEMLGPCLVEFGTEEQKRRFLPGIVSGDSLWCQGFSEPDAGSDLPSVRTRAVRDGDEWVVTGQKVWTTMGHYCDWIYAVVRTDPAGVRTEGLSILLVDMRQPGVVTRPIRNIANGREFDETFFDGARTSLDNVLGPVDGGFRVAMAVLGFERGTAVLPYQMMFEQEMDEVIALARRRGASTDPVMRQRLADAWIGLQVLRYNNYRKLTALMNNGLLGPESSFSKLYWASWHQRLSNLEMELMGPASELVGENYELNLMQRSFLVSRAETIYGGTNEIHRNTIGERVLGLPRSPRSPRSPR